MQNIELEQGVQHTIVYGYPCANCGRSVYETLNKTWKHYEQITGIYGVCDAIWCTSAYDSMMATPE